jgi:hypothetical protein
MGRIVENASGFDAGERTVADDQQFAALRQERIEFLRRHANDAAPGTGVGRRRRTDRRYRR